MEYIDPVEQFKIKGVYLEITSRCNLRCLHCYNESGNLKDEIPFKKFIELVDSIENKGESMITISGGEPLLHPDIWKILEYISKKKIHCLVITNATLITKDVAEKLVDLGISIQVSLNGNEIQHNELCGEGTYQRTVQGLEKLIEAGHENIVIRCMISKANMEGIEEFLDFAFSMVDTVSLAMLSVMGRGKQIEKTFDMDMFTKDKVLKELHQHYNEKKYFEMGKNLDLQDEVFSDGCPLIYKTKEVKDLVPRIDSNGKVFLCQMFDEEKYSIGNIYDMSLSEMLQSEKMCKLINYLSLSLNYKSECIPCVWKNSCGKGCIAQALGKGGIEHTDGDCIIRKYIYGQKLCNTLK